MHNILKSSKQFDYSTINCVHRVAQQLLKTYGFTLDPAIIQRTGEYSMSFQTSLILLEETIIHGNMQNVVGASSAMAVSVPASQSQNSSIKAVNLNKKRKLAVSDDLVQSVAD